MPMSEPGRLAGLLGAPMTDRVLAWRRGDAVTVAHFYARVAAWQVVLAAAPGARVALHFDDACEFAAALFATWHCGKQAWLPGDTLPATLDRLSASVDAFAGDLPGGLQAPDTGPSVVPDTAGVLDANVASVVLYTSGSNGEPVAINKTLRQLENEVAALENCFGAALGDAAIHGTVSHQHIYGLLFRVLWPLASGRAFHAQRLATPGDIAALPGPLPVAIVASPAHLKRLPPASDWRARGDALAAVFSSGGPLDGQAAERVVIAWGRRPIEVFGSTETGGIAWRQEAASAWTPLPGVSWRLAGERLEIRSPHLPDTAWHATSDRAAPAGEGFTLLGRADRIAKIEERRVSLTAIEGLLQDSPLVAEARVLVAPAPGARVAAVVVPNAAGYAALARDGKRRLVAALRQSLAGGIDAIALPRRWRFVDVLPTDAQGKVTDARLHALFRPMLPTANWLRREDVLAELALDIEADLAVFDGHFPHTPVLPGVAMLDWAVTFGREAFPAPPRLLRTEVLKFQALVRPGMRLHLAMAWRADVATLAFTYTSALGNHASGRLVFAEGQGTA